MNIPDWEKAGLEHVWLPYSQMKNLPVPLPVIGASGCKIKLADGRELIDGVASWWSACHGYLHPEIISAVEKQLKTLPHVMFGGLAHEPGYRLAAELVKILPPGLAKVFFSDSGSTAVEIAMKMAVQYWYNQGDKKKNRFICFRHGYHGDTMGAMSISDPEAGMHKIFGSYMPMQYVLDIPTDEYSFAEFKELVSGIKKTAAGLIIEPLVQCAGGMKFHSADILAAIKNICKENEILFIADEIATGFGRTGSMFGCDEAGITPDIICIGKALTGGVIGMAATIATEDIFAKFFSDNPEHAFMHGPTYMANPLACSAALASIAIFKKENRLAGVEKIEMQLTAELERCGNLPGVLDVRVKGAIGVVQLAEMTMEKKLKLRQIFIDEGCWIRPLEDVVYLMPPLNIAEEELTRLTAAIYKGLRC